MPAIFAQWYHDPVASSALAIAIVAGAFAFFQLRSIPRERRRLILDEMTKAYAATAQKRGMLLRECPMLIRIAYDKLAENIDERLALEEAKLKLSQNHEASARADLQLRHLYALQHECRIWNGDKVGIAYMSAAEILQSEFKLRAILWCVEIMGDEIRRKEFGVSGELYTSMEQLVGQLNSFAMDYENGSFPARTLFGQLHRSIAPTAAALGPLIWARSINGRWGRRVIRLGLAAEHYNDVTRIHSSSDLIWIGTNLDGAAAKVVVHPAITVDLFGEQILRTDIPGTNQFSRTLRLKVRGIYWKIIGDLNLTPGAWIWSYGGHRLVLHGRSENQLAACLRYALDSKKTESPREAFDFSWSKESLRAEMARAAEAGKAAMKRYRRGDATA